MPAFMARLREKLSHAVSYLYLLWLNVTLSGQEYLLFFMRKFQFCAQYVSVRLTQWCYRPMRQRDASFQVSKYMLRFPGHGIGPSPLYVQGNAVLMSERRGQ
jgi:hypothetical protein